MTRAATEAISPFFIVSNVDETIAFYRDKLGFEERFRQPESDPFFAIIGRDGTQIFVKSEKGTAPLPNPKRHPSMRWDAYVYVPNPDALAVELAGRGAAFSVALKDTHDGLRGFEICDPDGYVLFFGRPRKAVQSKNDGRAETRATLLAAEPQLFVSDVEASCEFYTKKLGFAVAFTYGEPPFYGQVFRDGARLNLRHLDEPAFKPELQAREQLLSASITVDDAEPLFSEFETAGVSFHQRLKTETWGARTFVVRDPDGNLILFAGERS